MIYEGRIHSTFFLFLSLIAGIIKGTSIAHCEDSFAKKALVHPYKGRLVKTFDGVLYCSGMVYSSFISRRVSLPARSTAVATTVPPAGKLTAL